MELDDAIARIGEFGRYQRLQYFIVNLCAIPQYFQFLLGVFVAAQPSWKCESHQLCQTNGKICHKPKFLTTFSSIVTEWKLYCNDAYKAEAAQSILMAGFLVGAFLGGMAADRYGRKKVWRIALLASSVLGSLCAFSTSLEMFVVLRFLQGIFIQSVTLTTFVLATEMVGPSYRGPLAVYVSIFAAISFPILAWMASNITNWRSLMLMTVAPQLVSLMLSFMIKESPRWLLTVGRVKEAENIINEAALTNGLQNPKISLKSTQKVNTGSNSYSILSMFTKRAVRTYTMVMVVTFIASGIGYFGLSMNVRNLGGSMYWNFALSGIVEIPSYFLAAHLLEKLGRRKTNFVLTLSGGIACLICMRLQQIAPESTAIINSVALLGKFCISAANALIFIYSAELYPTIIRNMALGVLAVSIRVGSIMAPFIVLLGSLNKAFPMQTISFITLIAAFLGLKLPETSGRPLPETFKDLQDLQGRTNHKVVSYSHNQRVLVGRAAKPTTITSA